jgi:O-methyltransferase
MKSEIKNILKEPWVDISFKRPTKKQEIEYNQTFRQSEKLKFFQRAFDFLYNNKISGDYFEFGCHKARTFRFALREAIIKNMQMNFHAFDSFEGLPDHGNNDKQNTWHLKGLLSTSDKNFKKMISSYTKYKKVKLYKGFYEDTLNNNLISKFKKKNIIASLINIDCDLEKSVNSSLNFALKFIQDGTILYIDDYYDTYRGHPKKGVPLVVNKLLKKYEILFEPWYNAAGCGKSYLLYK